ncbi:MAG: hypothetical protein ABI477_16865 [Chryseolinea sp.]
MRLSGLILLLTFLFFTHEGISQISFSKRTKIAYEVPSSFDSKKSKRWFLPGLKPDKQLTFRSSSTYRMLASNSHQFAGDPYWVGTVTQQSYNKGKIGRFYYWDLQGNLRDSFLFVDIAGRNRRGLKLVFPQHRALF